MSQRRGADTTIGCTCTRTRGVRRFHSSPSHEVTRGIPRGRIPLIDVGTIALIKKGRIAIRPGIDHFVEDGVVFTDGRREAFDAVILATGYRAGLDRFLEVDGVLDKWGDPRRDVQSLPDGLHLCGFKVVANGLLHHIGREAREIAVQIAGLTS